MTTLEIILLVWLGVLTAAVIYLYRNNGSHMNELEDEAYPECECRGFVKKNT